MSLWHWGQGARETYSLHGLIVSGRFHAGGIPLKVQEPFLLRPLPGETVEELFDVFPTGRRGGFHWGCLSRCRTGDPSLLRSQGARWVEGRCRGIPTRPSSWEPDNLGRLGSHSPPHLHHLTSVTICQ